MLLTSLFLAYGKIKMAFFQVVAVAPFTIVDDGIINSFQGMKFKIPVNWKKHLRQVGLRGFWTPEHGDSLSGSETLAFEGSRQQADNLAALFKEQGAACLNVTQCNWVPQECRVVGEVVPFKWERLELILEAPKA